MDDKKNNFNNEISWDYKGYMNLNVNSFTPMTQNDWNQTLITRINESKTHINMKLSSRNLKAVDPIFIRTNLTGFAIIENFDYFFADKDAWNKSLEENIKYEVCGYIGNSSDDMKYIVLLDPTIKEDKIIVATHFNPEISDYHFTINIKNVPQIIDKKYDDEIINVVRDMLSDGDIETYSQAVLCKLLELRGTPVEINSCYRDIEDDFEFWKTVKNNIKCCGDD